MKQVLPYYSFSFFTSFNAGLLRILFSVEKGADDGGVGPSYSSPNSMPRPFSLVESYRIAPLQIHHFDLYRIHDETELEYIGFRDYFTSQAICCIEWPERAMNYMKHVDVKITLELEGAGRHMKIDACSPTGAAILSCFAGE